jgi:hypothetical protein
MEKGLMELEKRTLSFPQKAQTIRITDTPSLQKANDFLSAIKALQKEISETFDPLIKKAHEAHRAILDRKKKYEEPLIQAEKTIKPQIARYYSELERIRKDKEEKNRIEKEEAERKEREQLEKMEKKAAALAKKGKEEEAQDLLDSYVPKVFIQEALPEKVKLQGTSIRTVVKWRVVDEKAIPREFLCVDATKVTGVVRTSKMDTKIPGIEVYEEKEVAAGRVGSEF